MGRQKQIYDAGQLYSDSMDEFQRYHTYPKGAFIDGAKWADENPKPEMVNKQEFIDKACEIYKKHILKFNTPLREFSTALDEVVNVFRKQLEA